MPKPGQTIARKRLAENLGGEKGNKGATAAFLARRVLTLSKAVRIANGDGFAAT